MKLSILRTTASSALFAALALASCGGGEAPQNASSSSTTSQANTTDRGGNASPAAVAETTPAATEVASTSTGRSSSPAGLEGFDLSGVDAGQKQPSPTGNVPPGVEPVTPPAPDTVKIPNAANRKAKIAGFEGADTTMDFGELRQGDKGKHVFKLISDGEEDLVIAKIKPSCGCTLARTTVIAADGTETPYQIGEPIPVGTRFEIETQLKTDGRSGLLTTQVQLTGNTPEPVTNLKLKAKIQPILELQPSPNLNFGQMTSNLERDGSLTVTSAVLDPFRLMIDEKFVVDPLQVEVEPVDPDAEGKSTTWTINVHLGPNVPEGFRNYPLRFTTDSPIPEGASEKNFEIRAYVQAQVTGLVAATPAFVSFGVVRPGQELSRKVVLECYDDFQLSEDMEIVLEPLQKNLEVAYLDRFSTDLKVLDPNGSRAELTVTLTGMPDDFNSSFGGMIRAVVKHPLKDEVTVRFSGVCRVGLPTQPGLPPQPGDDQ